MPAYAGSLKAAELQSIVAFLETRHQPGAVSSQPTPSQP
jgi:hypothetical protein